MIEVMPDTWGRDTGSLQMASGEPYALNRACTFQCIRLSKSHFQNSCVPSPCIGHYLDHLSTMDTPSPCVSRRLGDPQVPLHITSVRRFPVRPFAFSSIAMEEIFRKSHNRAS